MKKIFWVSRHEISPAQLKAMKGLHGEDVEIMKDAVMLQQDDGLAEYVREHSDAMVYAVAGAVHYLVAGFSGLRFGVFVNHPQKRQDGSFGLASVYWVNYPEPGQMTKVLDNPDPLSDTGESLVPVLRQ